MSRNLQSQTKLTEFAPLSPEQEEGSGLGYLFYKFFKRPTVVPVTDEKPDNGSDTSGTGGGTMEQDESLWQKPQQFMEEEESRLAERNEPEREFQLDVCEGRSLPNVLKRISNLLALKNTGGRRSYNDTALKKYWMPDSVSKECYDCGERFTTFRRRHHCRVCGQIFCARCCNQEIPGKIMNCTGDLRVCMYCGKVVLSYVQSADIGAELSADLKALHQDLHSKFGGGGPPYQQYNTMSGDVIPGSSGVAVTPPVTSDSSASTIVAPTSVPTGAIDDTHHTSTIKRKPSLGYREEKFAFARSNSETVGREQERTSRGWLRSLADEAVCGVRMETQAFVPRHAYAHRIRAVHQHTATSPVQASHLVDWLIEHNKVNNRLEGVALCQAMLDCGYIKGVSDTLDSTLQFVDDSSSLYRVTPSTITVPNLHEEDIKQDSSAGITFPESEFEFLSNDVNLPSSNSIFNLNLNLEEKTAHLSKPAVTVSGDSATVPSPSPTPPLSLSEPNNTCQQKMDLADKKESNNRENLCEIGVRAVVEAYQKSEKSEQLSLQPVHWNDIQPESLTQDSPHKHAYNDLRSAFDQHIGSYLRQLLNKEGISQSWANVISSLCQNVVKIVKPDFSTLDEMDIRQYVQFKKVSGGDRNECEIIGGVVCSKNVAHRAMPTTILNPKILLLSCPIVYQRVEGKFLSLEPVIMQEQDYIRHTVARIAALGADLVVVGRNVSRLAQEALLDKGMSLVLNVKMTVLERIARTTGADILTSVDSHVGQPKLGTCALFHLRTFTTDTGHTKTLMVLEVCPMADLGCTVLLRGASVDELAKIKRTAASMIFAYYNAALEFSYLLDAHASPPRPPSLPPHDTFFHDDTHLPQSKEMEESNSVAKKILDTSSIPSSEGVDDYSSSGDKNGNAGKKHSLEAVQLQLPICRTTKETDDSSFCGNDGNGTMENILADNSSSCGDGRTLKKLPKTNHLILASYGTAEEGEESPCLGNESGKKFLKTRDRLSSEEKMKVNVEAVSDFSDPLHSYLNLDEDVTTDNTGSQQALSVSELPLSNKFRKALEDNILSVSPYLKFTLPYLESESGRNCALRSYFGQKLYWSSQLHEQTQKIRTSTITSDNYQPLETRYENIKLLDEHRFVRVHLTEAAESVEVRTLLAEFRACGGRIPMPDPSAANKPIVLHHRPPPVVAQHERRHHHGVDTLRAMDVLEPDNHQTISVLFCSYSPISHNAPSFCVDPWVVDMELYGRNDIPLGAFLERYCFRKEYVCPSESCDVTMLHHTRRFVHDGGAVHVALRHLNLTHDQAQPNHHNILMWTCCTRCKMVTPIVAMSPATWRLSFAKYLELRFHGNMYTVQPVSSPMCQHSLHHDHTHYFAHKNIVASFTYSKISVWEISLPPLVLETERELFSGAILLEEIKTWSLLGHQAFSAALNKLCSLTPNDGSVASMKLQLQKDQALFKARVEEVQTELSSLPNENGIKTENSTNTLRKMWNIKDSVVMVKRLVAETIDEWNSRLLEADANMAAKKREDKKRIISTGSVGGSTNAVVTEKPPNIQQPLLSDIIIDGVSLAESEMSGKESPDLNEPQLAEEATNSNSNSLYENLPTTGSTNLTTPVNTTGISSSPSDNYTGDSGDSQLPSDSHPHAQQCDGFVGTSSGNLDVKMVQANTNPPQLSEKKSVKTILSQLLPTAPHNIYIQSPMSQCEHYCLPVGCPLPVVVYEREPSSIIAYALTSTEYRSALDTITTATATNPSVTIDFCQPPPSPLTKQKVWNSVFDGATGKETGDGGGSGADHQRMRSSPSPAPTPASTTMLAFLRNSSSSSTSSEKNCGGRGSCEGLQLMGGGQGVSCADSGNTVPGPPPPSATSDEDTINNKTTDDTRAKTNKNHQSQNIEVQFGDTCATFKVKVYFAEEFCRLRSLVLPYGEESFIRSLTRCVPWAATGGKSGSNFSKTKDDRFILKEMSRLEIQLFMEFAPQYFTYMGTCVRSRSPTLLGKIVGVYRVTYRNATNSYRSNLLVMEHLFHARLVTNKFDLKGSVRNRLVDTSSESERETVLLDENLINMTCDSPLYILPHSKTILMQAIHNDTQFLATQSVMDYSLLVGLDHSNRELVVGIIDYIRTFTWDKKLETMVKRYGLLGQNKQPTIISPDEYRDRFIAAMHRYFLPVPDRWTRLANGIDC